MPPAGQSREAGDGSEEVAASSDEASVSSGSSNRHERGPRTKSGGSTMDAAAVEERLRSGQRALRVLRCRVSGTLLLLAVALGVLCRVLRAAERMAGSRWSPACAGAAWLAKTGGLLLLALAPLADDMSLTRLVLLLLAGIVGVDVTSMIVVIWHYQMEGVDDDVCIVCGTPASVVAASRSHFYFKWVCLVVNTTFALWALVELLHTGPKRVQRRIWRALAVYFCLLALVDLTFAIFRGSALGEWNGTAWYFPGDLMGLFVAMRPPVRHALQESLRRSVKDRTAAAAAAGIASLVGRCDAAEVLAQASARFRVVPLRAVALKDLASNAPDPSLIQDTLRTKLRRCDAFVSHSWHDDPALKWSTLQCWRRDFLSCQDREPTVWFDKWCIDQKNIQADLRCLPIFLSGCRRLVVLCGPTYLSRLWCIVELFTFVRMGGSAKDIDVLPLAREDTKEEDMEAIRRSFRSFDARRCECFDRGDKENMMVIIDTAFGRVQAFNAVVRKILDRAVFQEPLDLKEGGVRRTITLAHLDPPCDEDACGD